MDRHPLDKLCNSAQIYADTDEAGISQQYQQADISVGSCFSVHPLCRGSCIWVNVKHLVHTDSDSVSEHSGMNVEYLGCVIVLLCWTYFDKWRKH